MSQQEPTPGDRKTHSSWVYICFLRPKIEIADRFRIWPRQMKLFGQNFLSDEMKLIKFALISKETRFRVERVEVARLASGCQVLLASHDCQWSRCTSHGALMQPKFIQRLDVLWMLAHDIAMYIVTKWLHLVTQSSYGALAAVGYWLCTSQYYLVSSIDIESVIVLQWPLVQRLWIR